MTKLDVSRPMPLREVVNHVEHSCRELQEHLQMDLTTTADELNQLTRPRRRKSAYPTIRNVSNTVEQAGVAIRYGQQLAAQLEEGIAIIEKRARELR